MRAGPKALSGRPGPPTPQPVLDRRAAPLMEIPDGLEAEPEAAAAHETDGEAGERDARIKTLLGLWSPPGKRRRLSCPTIRKRRNRKKGPRPYRGAFVIGRSPFRCGKSALGEGSGKEGVLGKGAWWRVEQPGVDGWHYLAGRLTAKNGARVRAIALEAECDRLPEHLRGWAQKVDDYFVVLIDAKTGAVLPDDAC